MPPVNLCRLITLYLDAGGPVCVIIVAVAVLLFAVVIVIIAFGIVIAGVIVNVL